MKIEDMAMNTWLEWQINYLSAVSTWMNFDREFLKSAAPEVKNLCSALRTESAELFLISNQGQPNCQSRQIRHSSVERNPESGVEAALDSDPREYDDSQVLGL